MYGHTQNRRHVPGRYGPGRGPKGSNGGLSIPLDRRTLLWGGGALGAAALATVASSGVLGGLAPSSPTAHLHLVDNTDRRNTSEAQAGAILRMALQEDKALYEKGDAILVANFTKTPHDPVVSLYEIESPGNEASANIAFQSKEAQGELWRREVATGLEAAMKQALEPMAEPQSTLLFPAVEIGIERARRAVGETAPIRLRLYSDMLMHDPNGLSAYSGRSSVRFPLNAGVALPQGGLAGVTIELVGIRRDGRKTRRGQDLGALQREIAPFLKAHYEGRGASVSLKWV